MLTKDPPPSAALNAKLTNLLERADPFCYGYNNNLDYSLTNANIFLKDGTTAKFISNGGGITYQQGDWEPIKIENDVLLELSFNNRTYTGEIPLYEKLTNEYPNGLDPNKPDPFKNNSTTNRLLVILEENNVDFSATIDTGTDGYIVRALHGMDGGKVITILKQQATGVVDLENGDLDEIKRTYSLGTYLMVPTGTTVYPEEPVEEKPVEFTELKTNLLNTEFKRVTAIVNKERVVDNTDIEGQLETLTGINFIALKCRKLPTGDFNKFDWTKETSVAFDEFITKEVFLYTYLLELVVVNSGRGIAKRLVVESSLKPENFKAAITNEKDCTTKYMYLEEYLAGENIAKLIKPKLTFRANSSSVTLQENVKTIELNPKVKGKIVPNDAEEVVTQLQEVLTNTATDVATIKRSDFVQFADVIDEDLNRIRIS